MADITDLLQIVHPQSKHLQLGQQLETFDLLQFIPTYILRAILKLRVISYGQPRMEMILSVWQYLTSK